MNRRGAVLLEILVALVVLSVAGVSTMRYLAAVTNDRARIESRVEEFWRAERLLLATALLSRQELEQRLGFRELGSMGVWVARPEPTLFRIGVARTASPEFELVVTVVYRRREEESGET